MQIFKYGQKEIDYLKSRDKKLGAAIDKIGMIERQIMPEPFTALIRNLVGQQISTKAAVTIWNKLSELLLNVTPANIANKSLSEIQGCGMTFRKAEYIKQIANASLSGELNFDTLENLTDEQIIKKLTSYKGIGIWTAEMLLIFSLNRPDIISFKDLGIRRGMMNLYGLKELSKEKFEKYKKRYSPYASVASLYLWELSKK